MSEVIATKSDLAAEAVTWAERAKGLRIVDAASCVKASHLLRSIKGLRSDIQRWFAPHLEAAMETKRKAETARKGLADEQARMEANLVEAEAVVKKALVAWDTEQERVRLEQQRKLQAEAQREAERLSLEAAAAMEMEANTLGDAEMLQEARELFAQPNTPVVTVEKSTPKVEGITYRDNWKAADDVDVKALAAAVAAGAPTTFITANMSALNAFARATKGTATVDGVRFFNDRQIAARG